MKYLKIILLALLAIVGVSAFFLPSFDNLALAIIMFILGLVMVIKGGDVFVDGASTLAKALNIPTFIIGATIVSIATTLPETLVSCFAVAEGKVDMSVGNAIGSVTANTALIMAIAMLAMNIKAERKQFGFHILALIASTAALLVFSLSGKLSVAGCIVLAVIFVVFMVYSVGSGRKQSRIMKCASENNCCEGKEEADGNAEKGNIFLNIFLFIVGAAGMAGGSRFMVNYGSFIAGSLGVPEGVIGLTIVAVGTSLPELVTTITAIIKKESNLSIGNVIGANIIDVTMILPLCSAISGQLLPISTNSLYIDFPVCILATLIATVPLLIRQKAHKAQGAVLLTIYVGYMVFLILNSLNIIVI